MEELAGVVSISIVSVAGTGERRPDLSHVELDSIRESVRFSLHLCYRR